MNQSDETTTNAAESRAGRDRDASPASATPPESTGHPDVDAVMRSVAALGGRPLEEHVRTFEAAHEQLRAALSAAADGQTSSQPGPPHVA